MSQTSYSINTPAWAYPGQIADSGFEDILSALAVAAALPYGLLAVIDSTNSGGGFNELAAKLPGSSADVTTLGRALGIVVADQARAQDPSVAAAQYPQFAAVPCGRKGRFVPSSESAVTAGAPVYVRFATGSGGTQPGSFSAVLDTVTVGNALLPGARWIDTTTGAGFAVVEMDLV